jgi:hypothetical protein
VLTDSVANGWLGTDREIAKVRVECVLTESLCSDRQVINCRLAVCLLSASAAPVRVCAYRQGVELLGIFLSLSRFIRTRWVQFAGNSVKTGANV